MQFHAHKMIADVAIGMAESVFEEAMSRDNALYRDIRKSNPGRSVAWCRRRFVRRLAPLLVGDARATLAGMLQSCDDPALQNEIYDALLKDAALRRGRGYYERPLTRN